MEQMDIQSLLESDDDSNSNEHTLLLSSSNQVIVTNESTDEVSIWKKWKLIDTQKKFCFFFACILSFSTSLMYGLLIPFFPINAYSKGCSFSDIGYFFFIYEGAFVVASLTIGRYLSHLGVKFTVVSATFFHATTTILFGLVIYSKPGLTFKLLTFIIRTFEGFACGAFVTSATTMLTSLFTDDMSKFMGIQEFFFSLGMMTSPIIGGWIYEKCGFSAPFYIVGIFELILMIFTFKFMPSIKPTQSAGNDFDKKILKFFVSPEILFSVFLVALVSFGFGYLDPTFQLIVAKFSNSSSTAGLLFGSSCILYGLLTPIIGLYVDRHLPRVIWFLVIGGILSGFGFLLLSPWHVVFFWLHRNMVMLCISMVLFGIGFALISIPTLTYINKMAEQKGFQMSFQLQGTLAGVFNAAMAMGFAFGPIYGGVAVDTIGLQLSSSIIGFGVLLCTLFLIVNNNIIITDSRRKMNGIHGNENIGKIILNNKRKFNEVMANNKEWYSMTQIGGITSNIIIGNLYKNEDEYAHHISTSSFNNNAVVTSLIHGKHLWLYLARQMTVMNFKINLSSNIKNRSNRSPINGLCSLSGRSDNSRIISCCVESKCDTILVFVGCSDGSVHLLNNHLEPLRIIKKYTNMGLNQMKTFKNGENIHLVLLYKNSSIFHVELTNEWFEYAIVKKKKNLDEEKYLEEIESKLLNIDMNFHSLLRNLNNDEGTLNSFFNFVIDPNDSNKSDGRTYSDIMRANAFALHSIDKKNLKSFSKNSTMINSNIFDKNYRLCLITNERPSTLLIVYYDLNEKQTYSKILSQVWNYIPQSLNLISFHHHPELKQEIAMTSHPNGGNERVWLKNERHLLIRRQHLENCENNDSPIILQFSDEYSYENLVMSSDGNHLICLCANNRLRIRSLKNFRLTHNLKGYRNAVLDNMKRIENSFKYDLLDNSECSMDLLFDDNTFALIPSKNQYNHLIFLTFSLNDFHENIKIFQMKFLKKSELNQSTDNSMTISINDKLKNIDIIKTTTLPIQEKDKLICQIFSSHLYSSTMEENDEKLFNNHLMELMDRLGELNNEKIDYINEINNQFTNIYIKKSKLSFKTVFSHFILLMKLTPFDELSTNESFDNSNQDGDCKQLFSYIIFFSVLFYVYLEMMINKSEIKPDEIQLIETDNLQWRTLTELTENDNLNDSFNNIKEIDNNISFNTFFELFSFDRSRSHFNMEELTINIDNHIKELIGIWRRIIMRNESIFNNELIIQLKCILDSFGNDYRLSIGKGRNSIAIPVIYNLWKSKNLIKYFYGIEFIEMLINYLMEDNIMVTVNENYLETVNQLKPIISIVKFEWIEEWKLFKKSSTEQFTNYFFDVLEEGIHQINDNTLFLKLLTGKFYQKIIKSNNLMGMNRFYSLLNLIPLQVFSSNDYHQLSLIMKELKEFIYVKELTLLMDKIRISINEEKTIRFERIDNESIVDYRYLTRRFVSSFLTLYQIIENNQNLSEQNNFQMDNLLELIDILKSDNNLKFLNIRSIIFELFSEIFSRYIDDDSQISLSICKNILWNNHSTHNKLCSVIHVEGMMGIFVEFTRAIFSKVLLQNILLKETNVRYMETLTYQLLLYSQLNNNKNEINDVTEMFVDAIDDNRPIIFNNYGWSNQSEYCEFNEERFLLILLLKLIDKDMNRLNQLSINIDHISSFTFIQLKIILFFSKLDVFILEKFGKSLPENSFLNNPNLFTQSTDDELYDNLIFLISTLTSDELQEEILFFLKRSYEDHQKYLVKQNNIVPSINEYKNLVKFIQSIFVNTNLLIFDHQMIREFFQRLIKHSNSNVIFSDFYKLLNDFFNIHFVVQLLQMGSPYLILIRRYLITAINLDNDLREILMTLLCDHFVYPIFFDIIVFILDKKSYIGIDSKMSAPVKKREAFYKYYHVHFHNVFNRKNKKSFTINTIRADDLKNLFDELFAIIPETDSCFIRSELFQLLKTKMNLMQKRLDKRFEIMDLFSHTKTRDIKTREKFYEIIEHYEDNFNIISYILQLLQIMQLIMQEVVNSNDDIRIIKENELLTTVVQILLHVRVNKFT
ncbi:hypothetical protein SNEBB_001934 [Seison nebaliae]|nr:hypothetical protein SNEBB_001934 [Seison nebaliae]